MAPDDFLDPCLERINPQGIASLGKQAYRNPASVYPNSSSEAQVQTSNEVVRKLVEFERRSPRPVRCDRQRSGE